MLTALKVILGGAYDSASGLIRDDLRRQNLLPTDSPYTSSVTTANATVFAATGSDAIVDWVLIELRSTVISTTVVASQAAFVQHDGDVVALNGTSAVAVAVSAANYYVVVKHRNHLSVMTASPVELANSSPPIDFTAPATAVYGNHALKTLGSVQVLWSGDTNGDNLVSRIGTDNDHIPILTAIANAPADPTHNLNYILLGYHPTDINLDGKTMAAGGGNDVTPLLANILTHPGNVTQSANYVVQGQVP